jgi:hypothetical protein
LVVKKETQALISLGFFCALLGPEFRVGLNLRKRGKTVGKDHRVISKITGKVICFFITYFTPVVRPATSH